jgi:phage shock protein E
MFSFLKPRASSDGSLSPTQCLERFADDATMLDVRTPGEFDQGHLACAINLDVMNNDFRKGVEALGLDASKPVYLYCRSGNRSGTAAKILREMGFEQAFNVGSYDALRKVGFETA